MMKNTTEKDKTLIDIRDQFSPFYESPDNRSFHMKVRGTDYEVCSHFNTEGTQSVLQQFKELILSNRLV